MSTRIFVASDGTGRTAEQAVNAALTQFPAADVKICRHKEVRTPGKVRKVVGEAKEAGGFIVCTIVSRETRDLMVRVAREQNVETVDLMGPLLDRLSQQLAVSPTGTPGLFGEINEEYFRRVESVEYAFKHDDGQRLAGVSQAQIVLVGVSRTFKTPLSIYLAFKGWFVANVPIVLELDPPKILDKLPKSKVFGLDTNPRRLADLRKARSDYLDGAVEDYTDPEYVRLELMKARELYRQHGWTVINVTGKPLEELAAELLALRGKRGRRRTALR